MKFIKNISLIIGSFMSLALMTQPIAAYAASDHSNGKGNGNRAQASASVQGDENEGGNGNGHGKALGHLTAPGWNRVFGTVANVNANVAAATKHSNGDDENGSDNDSDNNSASDPVTSVVTTSTTSTQDLPPVISGVSSPTVLNVGAIGTWSVSASDPQNGNLSYAVDWGDTNNGLHMLALSQPVFSQTATFTHAYSAPGVYTVRFTVKDDAGLTSNTSVTVNVVQGQNTLAISNVSAVPRSPSTATIRWQTNEKSTSFLWFSTTSPVDTSGSPAIMHSGRVTKHNLALTNLSPGTTYFVIVGSTDRSGQTVKAPELSFTTPTLPVTAPSIQSFTGPTTLSALTQGTWTVSASDPKNSTLSYSIDWGDSSALRALLRLVTQPVFVQTSTFDHTYANPGTYLITVTAMNSAGLKATATTSVVVTPVVVPAPVLSAIVASSTVPTQATISWTTDQSADSRIWFGTSTAVNTSATPGLSDPAIVMSHSETLTGLTASTTYFYAVGSMNGTGQLSTSSVGSFTTAHAAVVTPIAISNVQDSVSSTTVDFTWNTNILGDSEVLYSTSSPVVGGSATVSLKNAALVTNHALSVTDLTASTTYFFVVKSVDASSNATSTNEFSLTTPAI